VIDLLIYGVIAITDRQSFNPSITKSINNHQITRSPNGMPKVTFLDKQWQELMTLCAEEERYKADRTHPKLLKLIQSRIDALAREMGFNERRIVTRDFRAERAAGHIARIIAD
jgi:hypothetical protein